MKRVLSGMLVAVMLCSAVNAQAITVVNASFSDDGILHLQDFTPTGWTLDSGITGRGVELGGTEGGTFYWQGGWPSLALSNGLSQITNYVIPAAGEVYTLKVDAHTSWQGIPQINLFYMEDTTRVLLGSANLGLLGTWQTITLTAVSTEASVGKNLGILLDMANTDNVWAEYDNVRLVPEPATLSLLGLGLAAVLRKRK